MATQSLDQQIDDLVGSSTTKTAASTDLYFQDSWFTAQSVTRDNIALEEMPEGIEDIMNLAMEEQGVGGQEIWDTQDGEMMQMDRELGPV